MSRNAREDGGAKKINAITGLPLAVLGLPRQWRTAARYPADSSAPSFTWGGGALLLRRSEGEPLWRPRGHSSHRWAIRLTRKVSSSGVEPLVVLASFDKSEKSGSGAHLRALKESRAPTGNRLREVLVRDPNARRDQMSRSKQTDSSAASTLATRF